MRGAGPLPAQNGDGAAHNARACARTRVSTCARACVTSYSLASRPIQRKAREPPSRKKTSPLLSERYEHPTCARPFLVFRVFPSRERERE